ncbi:MAG: hypothetical protein GY795_42380 [Desulfobacterales bacterium]|nr:hypothetical protein [Desulfobacterales bacterium]
MNNDNSLPIEYAKKFVEAKFPGCVAALIGGSVYYNTFTEASDLDLIILMEKLPLLIIDYYMNLVIK